MKSVDEKGLDHLNEADIQALKDRVAERIR